MGRIVLNSVVVYFLMTCDRLGAVSGKVFYSNSDKPAITLAKKKNKLNPSMMN